MSGLIDNDFWKRNEAWYVPGKSNWATGGDATKAMPTGPTQYNWAQDNLASINDTAQGRQAPQAQAARLGQAVQLDGGPQDQSRQGMMDTTGRLGAIASGQQAGAGELAVNRQVGQANAAQVSAARMARGANAALAQRNMARGIADTGFAGAGQAAQAQMQDQQGANQQLGQLYGTMRGQDIDFAGQNAQLGQQAMLQQGQFDQQANIENMRAKLAQQGMNDQQQIAALGQMLGWDQTKIQAEQEKAKVGMTDKGALGGIFQGLGGLMAASDERLKTDVRDAGRDADDLMGKLKPKAYRYKDEATYGEGPRLGIMAQDLAKSKAGAATVGKLPDGEHLGFDVNKGISAALASVARLHERLEKVESLGSRAKAKAA